MEPTKAEGTQSKSEIRKKILGVRDNMPAQDRARCDEVIRERILSHESYREAQVILAYANYRSEVDTTKLIRQALADGKKVFLPKVDGEEMEFWQISSREDLRSGYRGIPEPVQNVSFPEWIAGRTKGRSVDTDFENKTLHDEHMDVREDRVFYEKEAVYERKTVHVNMRQKNMAERTDKDMDVTAQVHVMMWMPGAVFDKSRHRIGYGKGFYDRYLNHVFGVEGLPHVGKDKLQLITAALAYACQIIEKIPYEQHDISPDMVITETGIL